MFLGRQFRFNPVLTVFVAAGLAVLVGLGNWQLQRLAWKRELIAKVEARIDADPIPFGEAVARALAGEDMEYAPVRISGDFAVEANANVFGTWQGMPGAYVFMPLSDATGAAVYVNLGFAPLEWLKSGAADDKYRGGPVEITGLFRSAERPTPPASWFKPTAPSSDGMWLVRDPQLFAAAAEIKTRPYYIDSFSVSDAGEWPKGGTTRLDFHNRHLEYALTWFGLAATLIGVWLAFSLQKPNTSTD